MQKYPLIRCIAAENVIAASATVCVSPVRALSCVCVCACVWRSSHNLAWKKWKSIFSAILCCHSWKKCISRPYGDSDHMRINIRWAKVYSESPQFRVNRATYVKRRTRNYLHLQRCVRPCACVCVCACNCVREKCIQLICLSIFSLQIARLLYGLHGLITRLGATFWETDAREHLIWASAVFHTRRTQSHTFPSGSPDRSSTKPWQSLSSHSPFPCGRLENRRKFLSFHGQLERDRWDIVDLSITYLKYSNSHFTLFMWNLSSYRYTSWVPRRMANRPPGCSLYHSPDTVPVCRQADRGSTPHRGAFRWGRLWWEYPFGSQVCYRAQDSPWCRFYSAVAERDICEQSLLESIQY